MLTQDQVLSAVRDGRASQCFDGRDYARLIDFFPADQWPVFGFSLKDGAEAPVPTPWTEADIKKQLAHDVAFGFEKALGQRGLSAGLMYEVVRMWLWVLEDELQNHDDYPQYGLPLFKAVAVRYGLPNEIGDADGDESTYAE